VLLASRTAAAVCWHDDDRARPWHHQTSPWQAAACCMQGASTAHLNTAIAAHTATATTSAMPLDVCHAIWSSQANTILLLLRYSCHDKTLPSWLWCSETLGTVAHNMTGFPSLHKMLNQSHAHHCSLDIQPLHAPTRFCAASTKPPHSSITVLQSAATTSSFIT
jgi:hypothetical protein